MSHPQDAVTAPLPYSGTSRRCRISELMRRYKAAPGAVVGRYDVVDLETGTRPITGYTTEDMARAGARLQAARDIEALFDGAGQ